MMIRLLKQSFCQVLDFVTVTIFTIRTGQPKQMKVQKETDAAKTTRSGLRAGQEEQGVSIEELEMLFAETQGWWCHTIGRMKERGI